MPARNSLPSLGETPLMRQTRRSAWCAAMVRSGIARSIALNTVSTTVIGKVIHQRIAAGFTALTTVPVPEMFRYWLQGGRVTVGFLGGAQIDRYANLNTTVVGTYQKPKVRLPGGGGAPEIATSCGEIFITMAMSPRTFVEKLPFVTSLGHGSGPGSREALGITTKGPTKVITDLCVLEPDPAALELTVVSLHPGITAAAVEAQCAWKLRFAGDIGETPPPSEAELGVLRDLQARTDRAHGDEA